MKSVLLIGAGFTRSTRPRISLPNRAPLDADFFQIAKAAFPSLAGEVIKCLRSLVGDYADALCQSLETATSYLYIKAIDSGASSAYHSGFLNLLTLLELVLGHTTNSIAIGPRTSNYRFLLSELRHVERPEDLTVITFNYDLLLERTLESISLHGRNGVFNFPGCYRLPSHSRVESVRDQAGFDSENYEFSGAAVLKLHGSMNWQSAHTSESPTPAAISNPNRELNIVDTTAITHGLSWRRRQRKMYLRPIIVPPVSGKRGIMHRDVLSLWSSAANALQEADRVVIVGYSCPPLDLEARILLSENLRANHDKRVYVIDPNPQAAVKFLELCGVDHITIYSSIGSWVRDARH